MTFSSQLHTATPTLGVIDPRGLPIRTVAYCRSVIAQPAEARVTRQTFSLAGHLLACWDPRLWAQASRANLVNVHSLSGVSLLSDSVDAGWQLRLLAQAGNAVCSWDGRGTSRRIAYDALQRPVAIGETSAGAAEQIVERFDYAQSEMQYAANNQCGQLVRHDDPAGTLHLTAYALTGGVTRQTRHFLSSLDSPNWPAAILARDELLESGDGFSTHTGYNATGQVLSHTDALANVQQSAHTLDGQFKSVRLRCAGASQVKTLVAAIHYNAWGQIESELAGNGVVSGVRYDPENGQLLALESGIPGHPALQAFAYRYDPAGNLLSIEDRTLSSQYFRNQRIDPVNHYRYDSLYQLIEASGWEASAAAYASAEPPNRAQRSNYRQHYRYDAGGNLLELRHLGAQNYTRTFQVAPHSNRTLPVENSSIAGNFDSAFDSNGNLAQLQPGQLLSWNLRNQLSLVNPVSREEAPDDSERYIYDANGSRLRKVRHNQASGRSLLAEVRYLPGLELRSNSATGERLQVILCAAGRGSVHMLHWEQGLPAGIDNNQLRYNLADHLGSATLELDEQGNLLSKEVYYPFGATAWWQDSSASQGRYKVRRYSGKERDVSGLYYYGQRYYAPFLQRWINPDPAGYGDGLNLYCMVANSPLNFVDKQGTQKIPVDIFLQDIVDPHALELGYGEFEELTWDPSINNFKHSDVVYKKGMKVLEDKSPEWPSDTYSAIALFRDENNKLRLFTNKRQHMEIQPNMGMPLFAGRIQLDPANKDQIIFDNHSGHYKPQASIEDVNGWLIELAPQAKKIIYKPVFDTEAFAGSARLQNIYSPEEYVEKVNAYKNDHPSLIQYLKDQGLWGIIKNISDSAKALYRMATTGETPEPLKVSPYTANPLLKELYRSSNERRARVMSDPLTRRLMHQIANTPQLNASTPTAVSRPGFVSRLFGSCVGRR
ncbi:RHS repeat-associated core domain-containing protein [Pseudomonas alkylphenolica]|uniref:RHS repeat-associated core domain protein-containing protein n=1 Tax=Pseudomonas alkylphenolica TaxID=237609 RepID=A0A077F723_9PSED|nr:RHS repeat-associated core domain-containing protein [Pseudomonas alkylphenolica]AIL60090.1 RHS repeat-associated core domain protein-containing protein [Pseudomonas alkylphenolica]